jgi:hypothetical protein
LKAAERTPIFSSSHVSGSGVPQKVEKIQQMQGRWKTISRVFKLIR